MHCINLIVALAAEARPLIDHFRLKRAHGESGICTVYESHGMLLAVSGLGRMAAAATAGYVHGRNRSQTATHAWLNVGIAGHRSREAGEGFIAHSIIEHATDRVWHPPQAFD